jgi:DNA-binding MarR family transcriptional regulator
MRSNELVEDQWVYTAPGVVPEIKAHTFHITDTGRRELKFLQLLGEPSRTYPLGYCILMCLRDANLVTIGPIAKMLNKDRGEVKRAMKSLQNKGLVRCLMSRTRTTLGYDAITHLYRITELGREVLDAGPTRYLEALRGCSKRTSKIVRLEQKNSERLGIAQ